MNPQDNNPVNKELKLTVDVIIPAYHADDKFHKLLQMLYQQTIRPNQVFILHTQDYPGQEQPLPEIEGSNITVIPIEKKTFDHGGTRKYGASLSSADVIMFMTQDAIPADQNLIENLIEPYLDIDVAATYARQLPDENSDILERYTRVFNYPKNSRIKSIKDLDELGIKTFFCSDVCATYRNSVYRKMGGFVDRTIFNEDMIMAAAMIRSDYKVAYVAEARVFHSHKYTYHQQFTRNFDLGVSHKQYAEVFSGIKSEKEGIKLVINAIRYLAERRKYHLIPDLILDSGFKFLGYQLGKRYHMLPKKMVIQFSMNKSYWI